MATDSSTPRAPRRDLAVVALAALAAGLVLPSAGLVRLPFLPVDPAAYGALLTAVVAVLVLAVAPARRGRVWRVPTWLLALAPFWAYAWLEGHGPCWPSIGWVAVLLLAMALAWTPRRGLAAALVLAVLGGAAVLAEAGLGLLPAGWNAVTSPVSRATAPDAKAHPDLTRAGPRLGAAVPEPSGRPPALGEGPGPWWVRATSERHPGPRPVVLVLDGAATAPELPARSLPSGGGLTTVHGSDVSFAAAVELLAFDAVLVRESAWSAEDTQARVKAQAVAGFVRKGGLLIGPGPDHEWPPHLAGALRRAGRGRTAGVAGALRLGLGRVTRAALQTHIKEILDAGLWVPTVGTVLAARGPPPAWVQGLEHWRDRPSHRRTQGILLVVYVIALGAFTRLLRGGAAQLLGVLLASAAVAAGLAWTSPGEPGFRAHGLVVDLGGPGGRRLEAVLIDAGPGGYAGFVRWTGGGVVGLAGASLDPDGRVRVRPGGRAWIVRETAGRGPRPGEAEDVRAAILRPLLTGNVDPRRLRYGRLAHLPVRVAGCGPLGALTVAYRGE